MRRGTSGEGITRNEDGLFIGVNLGADYTAEHEMGIKDLERDFGLDKTADPGLPRRVIHVVPSGSSWSESETKGVVLRETKHKKDKYDPFPGKTTYVVAYTRHGFAPSFDKELTMYRSFTEGEPPKEVVGAWDEGSFGVHFAPDLKQEAQDLYDAIRACDVAFLWGNTFGNPFARAGLCLAIVSRLPQGIIDRLREMDEDTDALKAAAEATGIKAELDAFNDAWRKEHRGAYEALCGYYALSPRWADREAGTVKFLLNPTGQDRNNFGFYTADELRLWMKGEGPVLEKPAEKSAV